MNAAPLSRPHLQPPAVRFTLTRSKLLAGLLSLVLLLQLALLCGWAMSTAGGSLAFKALVAVILWLAAVVCSVHWWRHSPQGMLRWDGERGEWQQSSEAAVMLESPKVRLDLQSILLVQTRRTGSSPGIFLWLEQRADPLHWLALRRAVYSPASPELSAH